MDWMLNRGGSLPFRDFDVEGAGLEGPAVALGSEDI